MEKEKVQQERKEREEKEKKEKAKEKEKEQRGRLTLVSLMDKRLLGNMPIDDVSVPWETLPPRLWAYQQADRAKIPGPRWDTHRHGATTVFFNTTIPLFAPSGCSGISQWCPPCAASRARTIGLRFTQRGY